MSSNTSQANPADLRVWPLILQAAVYVLALVALLALTARLETDGPAGFFAPYSDYISMGLVVLFGTLAVQVGSKGVFAIAQKRMSPDTAGALRVIARIVGFGFIFSLMVSVLTENATAALTLGSFAGLVVGFASQTVMGNTLAGLFIAIARPIGVGDKVTIGSNSGTVIEITLMHTVLNDDDREILIPSSSVIGAVLVKHRPGD